MIINKTVKLLLGVAILLPLAGCSDEFEHSQGEDMQQLKLQGNINQVYLSRVNDSGFAGGDAIGVFIANYNSDGSPSSLFVTGNHADNVRFTFNEESNEWNGAYQLYWKDRNTAVDAYSYYPYDGELGSVDNYLFSIQRNQQENISGTEITGYEASDFLWAKATRVLPSQGKINLIHHHLMAGVQITLVEGDGFLPGEWAKLDKTILVENTSLNTSVNLSSGEVSLTGDKTSASITAVAKGDNWRAIVAPQMVDAGKSLLSITIDGESYRFSRNDVMEYNSGKLHKFTLQVTKRLPKGDFEISLLNEAITAWENDGVSHNASAREYIVVNCPAAGKLQETIEVLGLDPQQIVNLKITGEIGGMGWHGGPDFEYMKEAMTNLEALNLKEVSIKDVRLWYGYGEKYGLPNSLNNAIPYEAFAGSASLKYVVFPGNLKYIGERAFFDTNLTGTLDLPDGLLYIMESAFCGYGARHNSLSGELKIPQSVIHIGSRAFERCDFTGELVLPPKMEYLGSDAFLDCKYMTGTVQIPDGLTTLERAWNGMKLTGPVVVPQGIKVINGIGAPITSLIIPEGVEEVNGIFGQGWDKRGEPKILKGDIILPSTLKRLGDGAFSQTGISHVSIPEGIDVIPASAFSETDIIDTLKLPSTISLINHHAFYFCEKLNAVILPAGLKRIENSAFEGCFSLNYIQCLGSEPPVLSSTNVFNGVAKDNFTLVVPEGAEDAYRNAEGWKEFKRIAAYKDFVCRPGFANLLNKGQQRKVILNADDNWIVTHKPDWVTLSAESGYKKTELTITIDEMPHNQGNRNDSIVFQLAGSNDYKCYYRIAQYDYEHEEDSEVVLQNATRGNGIEIMFVGEGYDAVDISNGIYMSDMNEEMEYFFGVEPYKTYRDYFTVRAAIAVSNESGIGSTNFWRDTKFNCNLNSKNGRMGVDAESAVAYLLGATDINGITESNLSKSLIIMVANTTQYEGVTYMWRDGSAVAVCTRSDLAYPNDARGLIQHEAGGHGFGKLGDEYIYHQAFIQMCSCIDGCGHVEELNSNKALGWYRNLSLDGRYGNHEWRHLIFDSRYSDIVDIYEGGYFHSRGVYRSEVNSCMNNNVPYFSTVSRQAIVERIMDYAGEAFDFETFVSRDSRDVGQDFSRSTGVYDLDVKSIPTSAPIIKKGSPLDKIKRR